MIAPVLWMSPIPVAPDRDIIDALLIYDFPWDIDGFLINNMPRIMDRITFVYNP